MRIEKSTVTKMVISEVARLDPVTVFVEDLAKGKGKITIECYFESWSAYWGGMGDQTLAEFFCSVDEHYIAKNINQGLDSSVTDAEAIKEGAFRQIITLRRGVERRSFKDQNIKVRTGRDKITSELARELWEEVDLTDFGDDGWRALKLMEKIFGDEWWYALPTKPNPKYQYLCRIIKAVQDAFAMEKQEVVA